jgi:hypothetical protein
MGWNRVTRYGGSMGLLWACSGISCGLDQLSLSVALLRAVSASKKAVGLSLRKHFAVISVVQCSAAAAEWLIFLKCRLYSETDPATGKCVPFCLKLQELLDASQLLKSARVLSRQCGSICCGQYRMRIAVTPNVLWLHIRTQIVFLTLFPVRSVIWAQFRF